MAFVDLEEELNCSICLDIYNDPVSLRCGHNFCQECVVPALKAQKTRPHTCPECKTEYAEWPELEKNRKLRNIVEGFRSKQKDQEKILCTYCVKSSVPAVKTCLHCEISLCAEHLEAHNKNLDHVLTEPTSSFSGKKCSIHKKPLEFYCCEDTTCLCTSCCLVGKHKGHDVILVEEAAEQAKKRLRNALDKLTPLEDKLEKRVRSLQEHKTKVQGKAHSEKQQANNLYKEIRRQVEIQEKKVLNDVSKMEENVLLKVSYMIKEVESQKAKLSKKIREIKKLSDMTDPIALLQDEQPNVDEASEGQDVKADKDLAIPDLDEVLMVLTLHKSITDFINNANLNVSSHVKEASDMFLDINTAHMNVALSHDLKTASFYATPQDRSDLPGRFTYWSQVLSTKSFSSGRHFWEIETSDFGVREFGVCYPSMERHQEESAVGENNKSWGLRLTTNKYLAVHNSCTHQVPRKSPCMRYAVYLDYKSGHLSFYQLCDTILHLHTFKATFTEPLHAVFYVDDGAWVKIKS
ncbi:E3 ubiquitin/ISG15 ligase TRIM25-like [Aquarana catesbeiana]|uniref:E3 ubiquitin/ISG15 ligase TRIM25-like n=1 Tax=Aquarana catesbeiana TaxID=8400 RepID=UPI003CC9ACDC